MGMVTAPGSNGDLRVNTQDLRQAAMGLARLSGAIRDLAAQAPAACSAAASGCPGWHMGAASSAAGARWRRDVTTLAKGVAGAGDNLAASAAAYETTETALIQKISAIGSQAGR
jgi:uncharacterized protein YukE